MPSSIGHNHEMVCPNCGQDHAIDVSAKVWTRLTADGADVDESHDGDQEWTADSFAKCCACGHVGTVAAFNRAYEECLADESCERCGATGSSAMSPAYFGQQDDARLCVDCGMDDQDEEMDDE